MVTEGGGCSSSGGCSGSGGLGGPGCCGAAAEGGAPLPAGHVAAGAVAGQLTYLRHPPVHPPLSFLPALPRLVRNILADKPRVTKFPIEWDAVQQQQAPSAAAAPSSAQANSGMEVDS